MTSYLKKKWWKIKNIRLRNLCLHPALNPNWWPNHPKWVWITKLIEENLSTYIRTRDCCVNSAIQHFFKNWSLLNVPSFLDSWSEMSKIRLKNICFIPAIYHFDVFFYPHGTCFRKWRWVTTANWKILVSIQHFNNQLSFYSGYFFHQFWILDGTERYKRKYFFQ